MPIISAILVLSILILVHELGHFLAAKLVGVWPEEFGIGLPPRIWGKKIGKTLFSVNALPIGGFVRLHGETGEVEPKYPKRAFVNKSKISRIFVAVAGVGMNFLLAVVLFTAIFFVTGIDRGVKIIEVAPESPASVAGILAGDRIRLVEGEQVKSPVDFPYLIDKYKGKEIDIDVIRGENGSEKNVALKVVMRNEAPQEEGLLGVAFIPAETYFPSLVARPLVFLYYGFLKAISVTLLIVVGLWQLISELIGGSVPSGVAGPVGVTALIAEVGKMGIVPVLDFMALISINLAVLNLVPFPPLDGSRVVFILLEIIFGKKRLPKIEVYAHSIGMIILLGLMILVTANEIPKLLTAGSLSNFVETLIQ